VAGVALVAVRITGM